MVVLLSLTVANTVLFFVENLDDTPVTAVNTTKPSPSVSKPSIDLTTLNLFGIANQTTVAAIDAPETKLNLELQGVFTAESQENSTAIVAERNKDGLLYHVGDRLPGNAILSAVYDDHILIRRGARTEKLMFSDAKLRRIAPTNSTTQNQPEDAISAPNSASQPVSTSSRLQEIRNRIAQRKQQEAGSSSSTGGSLREYITENQQRLEQDPQALMQEIGISPVNSNSSQGYKISGNESSALAQTGLKAGDVVVSVNGKPVGNVQNDRSLINQALEAKRVRVEVQRGERRFFLTVPIP